MTPFPACAARSFLALIDLRCILPGEHKGLILSQLERFQKVWQHIGTAQGVGDSVEPVGGIPFACT